MQHIILNPVPTEPALGRPRPSHALGRWSVGLAGGTILWVAACVALANVYFRHGSSVTTSGLMAAFVGFLFIALGALGILPAAVGLGLGLRGLQKSPTGDYWGLAGVVLNGGLTLTLLLAIIRVVLLFCTLR